MEEEKNKKKLTMILGIIAIIIIIITAIICIRIFSDKEEIKKYGMHVCAGNFYGFCFALLVITAILLATL